MLKCLNYRLEGCSYSIIIEYCFTDRSPMVTWFKTWSFEFVARDATVV